MDWASIVVPIDELAQAYGGELGTQVFPLRDREAGENFIAAGSQVLESIKNRGSGLKVRASMEGVLGVLLLHAILFPGREFCKDLWGGNGQLTVSRTAPFALSSRLQIPVAADHESFGG